MGMLWMMKRLISTAVPSWKRMVSVVLSRNSSLKDLKVLRRSALRALIPMM